jgi:hypothetical protein
MALKTRVCWIVAGCLLAGVGVAAAAQLTTKPVAVRYINCGVFWLLGGKHALMSVSLDDGPKQPSAKVRLEFIDTDGVVVASREATLEAGKTEALRVTGPRRVRAHAEVFEFTTDFTARRRAVWSVQVVDDLATEDPGLICNADGTGLGGGRQ